MSWSVSRSSRRIACGAIFFFLLGPAWGQLPEEEEVLTVRMDGYAEGVGLAARNLAVENAKQEIIRKVLNSIVADGDLSHLSNILRNAAAYIRAHEMLTQKIVGDGTQVEIDAYVETRPLYNDVAVTMLPYLPDPPHVLLVVGERIAEDKIVAVPDFGYAETALRESLEKVGLKVSGVDTISDRYPQQRLIEAVTGDVETGRAFAKGTAADIVILGSAVAQPVEPAPGTNVLKSRCTVDVRVYRGMDGDMMEAFSRTAAVSSVEVMDGALQATRDACEKLVADLTISAVLTVLGTKQDDRVLLVLENPGEEGRITKVAEYLEAELGAGQVETLLSSGELGRLRVRYDGPMISFVDYLSAGDFSGRHLSVNRAVGREVVASFEE